MINCRIIRVKIKKLELFDKNFLFLEVFQPKIKPVYSIYIHHTKCENKYEPDEEVGPSLKFQFEKN